MGVLISRHMTRIGKYDIQSELARGGIGRVYRAFDASVGRPVAIKVLNAETDREMLARFSQEAAAAGNLHHRNIVTIYEFGQDGDSPFIAMEFLEGRNLQEVIRSGERLSTLQVMQIMSQAADGLRAAHQHGIVHRDFKPGNIMLTRDGTVKLTDFGIARVKSAATARMTQKGDLVGTLFYMSPEQFSGSEADQLCDVFSFGIVYYELLTGVHPFAAEETAALIHKVIYEEARPVRELVPDVPEPLERLIARAMSKDRRDRYQHIEDLQIDAAPLLIHLQSQRAASLVVSARLALENKKPEEANDLAREALELDPSNRDARTLRASLREQLDAVRNLSQQLSEARRRLSREDLTSADSLLSQLLTSHPSHDEALSLQEGIREVMRIRDRARALRAQIVKARGLILIREYERAETMLLGAQAEYPEALHLTDLIEEARRLKQDSQAAQRRALRLQAVHKLIDEAQLDRARELIGELAAEDARAPEVVGLQERVRLVELQIARSDRYEHLYAEARRLANSGDWNELCAWIDAAMAEHPNDDLFAKLLREGNDNRLRAQLDQYRQQAMARAEALATSGRITDALATVHLAIIEIPDDPGLLALLGDLELRFREHQRRQHIKDECNVVRQLIHTGRRRTALSLLSRLREMGADEEELAILELSARTEPPAPAVEAQPAPTEQRADGGTDAKVLSRVSQVIRGFFN